MEFSVILAHPEPQSFNHAIANTVCRSLERAGHTVRFHDLYAEGFNPLLGAAELDTKAAPSEDLAHYCEELQRSDGLVIVHPNWWGQPPAILKGWMDRVIRPDVAYKFLEGDTGEGIPKGLLKAWAALVFNTSNTETQREKDVFGDPLETIWKNCIFGLCGVTNFHRRMFNVVVTSTEDQRRGWLLDVEKDIHTFFPKNAPGN